MTQVGGIPHRRGARYQLGHDRPRGDPTAVGSGRLEARRARPATRPRDLLRNVSPQMRWRVLVGLRPSTATTSGAMSSTLASPAVFEHRDGGDVHGDGLPSLTSNNYLADINKKFVGPQPTSSVPVLTIGPGNPEICPAVAACCRCRRASRRQGCGSRPESDSWNRGCTWPEV